MSLPPSIIEMEKSQGQDKRRKVEVGEERVATSF
jgi:hypothetical protein